MIFLNTPDNSHSKPIDKLFDAFVTEQFGPDFKGENYKIDVGAALISFNNKRSRADLPNISKVGMTRIENSPAVNNTMIKYNNSTSTKERLTANNLAWDNYSRALDVSHLNPRKSVIDARIELTSILDFDNKSTLPSAYTNMLKQIHDNLNSPPLK